MTKGEFIDEVDIALSGPSKKDAGAAVDAVSFGTISDTLKKGGDVAFTALRAVPRHEALGAHGRQPAESGPEVQIPATTVPKFSASSTLRPRVRG